MVPSPLNLYSTTVKNANKIDASIVCNPLFLRLKLVLETSCIICFISDKKSHPGLEIHTFSLLVLPGTNESSTGHNLVHWWGHSRFHSESYLALIWHKRYGHGHINLSEEENDSLRKKIYLRGTGMPLGKTKRALSLVRANAKG